ncbi:MAG TPA: ABC transporter ATP-binding protein, partial [Thermomicrobiales bacterium]|nr:ABC transporter ATP-binding protein [Thermomicrobiales bacterium]
TLLGFMTPTSGSAEILDLDIVTQRDRIHEQVGNLPGEFTLDDRMTGRQLIDLFGRLRNVSSSSYAFELAERLEADLDRPMRRLSRGNKQKIGIVQALFHQPDVVILDEPTGGLDPLAQETFLDLLLDARARGQTIFFSSHNLTEIERVAGRVGIIRDGELVAVENPQTLTSRTFRHVQMQFADGGALATARRMIEELDGIDAVQDDGATLRFDAHGDINQVIRAVATTHVESIDIERPSLEEVFLTYYAGEADTPAGRNEA